MTQAARPKGRPEGIDAPSLYARPLALAAMRWALQDWRAAKERSREAQRRCEEFRAAHPDAAEVETREWGHWVWSLGIAESAAERQFLAALCLNAGLLGEYVNDPFEELPEEWEPFAMELDGFHYVVSPRDDGSWPVLTIVEATRFDSVDFGRGDAWED